MSNPNRPNLIVLDEDANAVREIEEIAGGQFHIYKARSADVVMQTLKTSPAPTVLVVEQRFGATGGLSVLKSAQSLRPSARRVLIAGPGNLAETIEGLHSGAVERIIYKPIRAAELLAAIVPPAEGAVGGVRATA